MIMINWTKIKFYIKRLMGKHPFISRDVIMPVERFGTEYGGWNLRKGSVQKDSIVYSIGIGEDISFDLGIIEKYGCKVFAYDPTPKVVQWLKGQNLPQAFDFHTVGLASADGRVEFFAPENPDHVSHSAKPSSQHKGEMLFFEVKKLATLMAKNGHSHIDLLKMDIEGFEYDALRNILEEKLDVRQVLVEFHHGMYSFSNRETLEAVNALRNAGYKLFCISDSGREYSFYR
jgi:FkbM family methyltransferase